MRIILCALTLALTTIGRAQVPDFVSTLAFNFYPQMELLDANTAFVGGGHLAGIEFFQRGTLVDLSGEEATVQWVYNEDDAAGGFTTDALVLSNGNLLLFTPEDVALGTSDLEFHLTCLDTSGDLVWEVSYPVALTTTYFQARLRMFESSDEQLHVFTPVQSEDGLTFEIRHYSLDGTDLGSSPVLIDYSTDAWYDVGDMHLTADEKLVIVGRHSSINTFILGLNLDGSVAFETQIPVTPIGATLWYTHVSETASGELLAAGYYSNAGNLGMARRFSATGELIQEVVFGTAPDVVILRCIRELPDGRIAIGARWANEEGIWAPRLIVMDAALEVEEFDYFFESEVPGVVENMRIASNGDIIGINDLVLGGGERTDIWRMSSDPVSTDEIQLGERIRIGPNPATDIVRIFDHSFTTFEVRDASGGLVFSGEMSSDQIDISRLSTGVYDLHLFGSEHHAQTRLLKL